MVRGPSGSHTSICSMNKVSASGWASTEMILPTRMSSFVTSASPAEAAADSVKEKKNEIGG